MVGVIINLDVFSPGLIVKQVYNVYISTPWIRKGVSATLPSGRYTLSYPRGRYVMAIITDMLCTIYLD